MKPTKLFITMLASVIVWISMFVNVNALENSFTFEELETLLNDQWVIKIGCYTNGVAWDGNPSANGDIHCKGKNIMLPKKSHLQYFKKYFSTSLDKKWNVKYLCWSDCIAKLANRFALVNFESGFNPDSVSPTSDYGYIQVHNGKDFLWEKNIQKSLDRLDNRWINHTEELCQKSYKIRENDWSKIYKCLMMRHNWRRSIDNSYSNRALKARDYYISYLNKTLVNARKGLKKNAELLAKIDKLEERKEAMKEAKIEKALQEEKKITQAASQALIDYQEALSESQTLIKEDVVSPIQEEKELIKTTTSYNIQEPTILTWDDYSLKYVWDKSENIIFVNRLSKEIKVMPTQDFLVYLAKNNIKLDIFQS